MFLYHLFAKTGPSLWESEIPEELFALSFLDPLPFPARYSNSGLRNMCQGYRHYSIWLPAHKVDKRRFAKQRLQKAILKCSTDFKDWAFGHLSYNDSQDMVIRRELWLSDLIGFLHQVNFGGFSEATQLLITRALFSQRALNGLKEAYFTFKVSLSSQSLSSGFHHYNCCKEETA